MKQLSIRFLKAVVVLIGIVAIAMMIRLPLIEGRAENLDLFSIYFDPFILYGYASSIAFFVVLYKAFKLLGYIGQNELFSQHSIGTLRSIKYCAIILSILIVAAGLYIWIFHNKEDDPTGFLAICITITFVFTALAMATIVFENILLSGMELQLENEQLKRGLDSTINDKTNVITNG